MRRGKQKPPIAIVTDFGAVDPYVGIMKAVMLRIDPGLAFIDLCHELPPYGVLSASYVLCSAWPYLPNGAVVLAVVDPGVGSARRELIARAQGRVVVSPDNGTVSLLARLAGPLECFRAERGLLDELTAAKPRWSSTFDGRDLFAPLAAKAAAFGPEAICGETVPAPVLLPEASPGILDPGQGARTASSLQGSVIHLDRFGNCVSSVHFEDVYGHRVKEIRVYRGRDHSGGPALVLDGVRDHFSEVGVGEPLAYWGSAGFLEVAVREASAAARFRFAVGSVLLAVLDAPVEPMSSGDPDGTAHSEDG